MTRMLLSLGLVVAVILALRWGGVRVFGGAGAVKTSQVMQVVSRSIISPKQQLILVQVGRRLVMVGNSGAQLTPLAEITDADEVAELLGQARRDKNDTIGKTFGSWMRKAGMNFPGGTEVESTGNVEAASDRADGGPDRPYVADQEEWTTRPDVPPGEAEPLERPHPELAGLLGKVRGMSNQFGSR